MSEALLQALGDRYEIERVLGRGGMAVVHLAEERKHQRKVAIKILRQDVGASVGAERFLREIGIAARLSHPHIVPLIDSGEAHGMLYYVSPYVSGGSLRDRLDREKRLPVDDAIRIATEVGAGLDYAHRSGFVHRDVKPENILFADGHALLADFGIAHARNRGDSEPLTRSGMTLGTPEYMSPEQASGSDDIGSPTDIYALACVVYEMLAGQPPFTGATPLATMARHVTEKPKPVRALRPEVAPSIEQAVARALAKTPEQRFATVSDFTAALQSRADAGARSAAATRSIAVLPFVNSTPDPEAEEAERVLREGLEVAGAATYTRVTLAFAVARRGDVKCAEETLRLLERKALHDYVSPVEFTTLYIALGDADKAIEWARRAYDERRGWLAYLKVHPVLDPVRDDPRFNALTRQMGL
jgi:serine/threonine protein kinase